MGRLSNSWQTVKASWNVLGHDKELVLFPILSGIASFLIMASFFYPAYTTGLIDRMGQDDQQAQTLGYVLLFVMYLILSFITVYFNSALVFAANERLEGGNPTIGSGMRGANSRLGRIFQWAMFAGTVNFLIQLLQRAARRQGGAAGAIGSLITSMVGVAWNLATYFAVPVIVFEDRGVMDSLRRSGQLFKQRWGESLVGEFGIGMVFGIIAFVSVLLFAFVLFGLASSLGVVGLVATIVLFVVWMATLAIVGSALSTIYKAALYRFAKQGEVSPLYPPQLIQGAWRRTDQPTYSRASW